MAAVYTVTTGRGQKMTFSGQPDSIDITWNRDYYVDVSGVSADTVDAFDVLTATGIPVVNRSVYTIQSKVIPFVICRTKSAEQNPKRLDRWTVRTTWRAKGSQEESDNTPVSPPSAITDYTPTEVPLFGEQENVLYKDKKNVRYLSPTGNSWASPLIERMPTFGLKITQYEAAPLAYATLLGRLLRCNEDNYRGYGRYRWLITNIDPTVVDTEIASGSTTAIAVTYTIMLSPLDTGWKLDRSLIDSHHLVGGVKTPFTEGQPATLTDGLIDNAGVRLADQNGVPNSIQYEPQNTISYSTFMQA